jgi:hypothetical protein
MTERATLHTNMWLSESYRQTVETRSLREIMEDTDGWMIFHGERRELKYTKIAPGLYHLYKGEK